MTLTAQTNYVARATVAELRDWLSQFEDGESVLIAGTPESGWISAGEGDMERMFALYDQA